MVDDVALRFIGCKAHRLRAVARDRQQGNHRFMISLPSYTPQPLSTTPIFSSLSLLHATR
jgi:hypothetical protein